MSGIISCPQTCGNVEFPKAAESAAAAFFLIYFILFLLLPLFSHHSFHLFFLLLLSAFTTCSATLLTRHTHTHIHTEWQLLVVEGGTLEGRAESDTTLKTH